MNLYCPKCKTNFSDSFEECAYCGSPLVEGIVYCDEDVQEDNVLLMSDEDILKKYQSYRVILEEQIGSLSDNEFIKGLKDAKRDSLLRASLNADRNSDSQLVYGSTESKIKCPTCSSTNVQKISTGERVLSVAIWGVFSKKINKSFKCKNCGYTW